MSIPIKPEAFSWAAPCIRKLRCSDRFVKIELPVSLTVDHEMATTIFEDGFSITTDARTSWYGETKVTQMFEVLEGCVKDKGLFDYLVSLLFDKESGAINFEFSL